MNRDPRITPAENRRREWAANKATDAAWARNLGYWIAKAPGVLQLRWKVGKLRDIPWTPLKRPLAEAKVAFSRQEAFICVSINRLSSNRMPRIAPFHAQPQAPTCALPTSTTIAGMQRATST